MAKFLVVEREKVRANIRKIRQRAGAATVYGVIKGNGYGFGMIDMADMLRDEGVSHFAVTELRDLIILRNSGFVDEEILVLRSTSIPDEIEKIIEYNGVATIGSYEAAVALNGIAEKNMTAVDAHIEIDTGMGRYGFLPEETDKVINVFKYFSSINITGMYTHFYKAFSGSKTTKAQFEAFMGVVKAVEKAGFTPGTLHAANSSALLKFPYTVLDAVRVGSALTGRVAAKGNFGLARAGYAESNVVEVRWLQKNQTIGYGGDWKCKKSTRIAIVPIGYADGICAEKQRDTFGFRSSLRVALSAMKAWITHKKLTATIGGKTVRVLGHVGMQHTVIDVTNVECAVGDPVRFEVNPIIAGAMLPKKYV
ncbi:MAG: alanine racemase [Clostridia bacterium]|nr:alanine racemase [Clostridia bacterium]